VQAVPNKDISKSKILGILCAMKSSENTKADNVEWLQSNVCKLAFQHMRDMAIDAAKKQNGEEESGKNESEEEKESSEYVSHSMTLQCADTSLDNMCQTEFQYSDITARKICTAMRSLNGSQKQGPSQSISQNKH
jgi:hypothetical protein